MLYIFNILLRRNRIKLHLIMAFLNLKFAKQIALTIVVLSTLFNISFANNGNDNDKPEKINIQVNYLNRFPFFYSNENGKLEGIEIEILESFALWSRKKHNLDINFTFQGSTSFNDVYNAAKTQKGESITAGTITIKKERLNDVNFSAPYLRNISILISSGNKDLLSDLNMMDDVFANTSAIATQNSVHLKHLEELKRAFYPSLKIELVENQDQIPGMVSGNENFFGYVDLIQYWKYKKENPNSYIKVHRIADRNEEHFGFAFSKENTRLNELFEEFFSDGFGFTSTKEYHKILEKYLGEEIVSTVEVNFAGY